MINQIEIFNYISAYNAACEAGAEYLLHEYSVGILRDERIRKELERYCSLFPEDTSYLRDKYLIGMTQSQIAERDNYDDRNVYYIIHSELRKFVYYMSQNSPLFIDVRIAIDNSLLPLLSEDAYKELFGEGRT